VRFVEGMLEGGKEEFLLTLDLDLRKPADHGGHHADSEALFYYFCGADQPPHGGAKPLGRVNDPTSRFERFTI